MTSRSSRLATTLTSAALLFFWGCNSTPVQANDGGLDAGLDGGPDAGQCANGTPVLCGSIGAACTAQPAGCCGNLTCMAGICSSPAPVCAGYGERCDGEVSCCSGTASGGKSPLACTTLDAGLSVCLMGSGGSACSSDSECAAPYVCADAGPGATPFCNFPDTGKSCAHSPCQAGDSCYANAGSIQANGTSADPCFGSGLICYYFGNGLARCLNPTVFEPPVAFQGVPFNLTVCNQSDVQCASSSFDAPKTAPACGTNFASADGHCYASCQTGDDCENLGDDCIQGTCKPNLCFASGPNIFDANPDGGTLAHYLSPFQVQNGGLPISADPHVLFNSCLDAGFATACLPGYYSQFNTAAGFCTRVGDPGSGGWGALCDPNPFRNNLGGLCAAGTWCEKGTCMPWCDLGTTSFLQCPCGTTCTVVASNSPVSSSLIGTSNSLGVCAQNCNPYVAATENGCVPFPTDGGQAPLVCKFSEGGSDQSPAPGFCVASVDSPIAVGQACTPFGWADPCVSGAQCVFASLDGGGTAYECAQLCDPQPSPGVTAPSCATGTTCIPFGNCGGLPCSHQGTCQ